MGVDQNDRELPVRISTPLLVCYRPTRTATRRLGARVSLRGFVKATPIASNGSLWEKPWQGKHRSQELHPKVRKGGYETGEEDSSSGLEPGLDHC